MGETVLEDAQQVVGGLLVLVFAVPALVPAAHRHEPDRSPRRFLGLLDDLVRLFPGVTQLVQVQGGDPRIRSDMDGVAVLALEFGHSNTSAAGSRRQLVG
ncbi:hypothetical protein D3C78_1723550 [compost metagenome]